MLGSRVGEASGLDAAGGISAREDQFRQSWQSLEKSNLPRIKPKLSLSAMSTVKEIEAAIRSLPPTERGKLVEDLPSILPELNGDAEWERILNDPRPRPALTRLGDEIEAQLLANPDCFPEIRDSDFDRHS